MINTDIIRIETANIINQNNVNLIYFFLYGLINGSRLVHSQGGHVLENKHHDIRKNKMIINNIAIIIYGISRKVE